MKKIIVWLFTHNINYKTFMFYNGFHVMLNSFGCVWARLFKFFFRRKKKEVDTNDNTSIELIEIEQKDQLMTHQTQQLCNSVIASAPVIFPVLS